MRVRGIQRRYIFRTDADREDFVARLAALAEAGAVTVYAWALLPNHAHLLVRSGDRPLARSMRSLLTGYAGAFNRRNKRAGHLFRNRYKSVVVVEEAYLVALGRDRHLHPLRAGIVGPAAPQSVPVDRPRGPRRARATPRPRGLPGLCRCGSGAGPWG